MSDFLEVPNSQSSIVNRQSLDSEIGLIQHEGLRTLVQNVLEACPTCFWFMPSSTSGKYHPAISLGQGGLIRHTRAVVRFALHLLDLEGIPAGHPWHDTVLAACILHDCCKHADGEQHTAFDHPLRAAQLIDAEATLLACSDDSLIKPATVRSLCNMVRAHMGRWNTSRHHPGIELPTPLTPLERLVHTADYLASREDITLANLC